MARYILGRQAKNRSMILRYCTAIGLLLFFFAVFQTSVLARLKPFGVSPDLMITVVVTVAIYLGCHPGAITGIAAGFLTDALSGVGVSLLPLVYFLLGYLVGYYSKVLSMPKYFYFLICLGISLVVRGLTSLAYTVLSAGAFRFSTFLLKLALPEMLGTFVFGIVIFFPVMGISLWLKAKD